MKTFLGVQCLLMAGMITLQAQTGVTFTSLISFNQTNGADPQAGLAQGPDGNFYGTTVLGGTRGYGTIFQITPAGAFTNLVSFAGTNGADPRAGLLLGADGSFYGTTYIGGSNNAGILFQVITNGTLTLVHTFSFVSGGFPIAGLIQDRTGSFYGTAAIGGTNSGGTVFQLTTNGVVQTLVSFDFSSSGGNSPYAPLVQGSDGAFYGTTYQGGTNGYGTLFKIDTNGALKTLVSFNNTNGANPYAGLLVGKDGYLYGTTYQGGGNGYGTIFKIDTNGFLTTLVSFDNTNGAAPQAGLISGTDGNFYGTTSAGGDLSIQPAGHGTVFEMEANGKLTPLILFNGTNGDSPLSGLVQAADGNFYGTTAYGGINGSGTIFRFSLPVPPKFLAVTATGGTVALTWDATLGRTYQMLYKTNLNQTSWSNLNNLLVATNVIMTTTDVIGPDLFRFYQILSVP